MKIRIGLKSGKEFEMDGDFKTPDDMIKDIHENNYLYYICNGNIYIKTSQIAYIEEVKEKEEIKVNIKVDTSDFQKVLKEAQEALMKIKNYDTRKFI